MHRPLLNVSQLLPNAALHTSAISLLLLAAGSGDVSIVAWQLSADEPAKSATQKAQPKKKPGTKAKKQSATPQKSPPNLVGNSPGDSPPASRNLGRAEEMAVKKVATIIRQSLEVAPTL